jgi:DNA-binding NarL/FixJ family response regulator
MAKRGRPSPPPHSSEVAGPAHPTHPFRNVASIQLVIASPVRLVREGLAASLHGRDTIEIVDAVSMDAQGMARIAAATPNVVLVDIGQIDVATAAQLLKAAAPAAKLVAFALDEVDADVFACAAAGFSAYVPRESGAEELHRALQDAVDGRMHCAPHIAAAMFRHLAALSGVPDQGTSLPLLTSRESQILVLAEDGCSNKEIARHLTISCATVKNHMHNILQKLQVTRRGQAVARLRLQAGSSGRRQSAGTRWTTETAEGS